MADAAILRLRSDAASASVAWVEFGGRWQIREHPRECAL